MQGFDAEQEDAPEALRPILLRQLLFAAVVGLAGFAVLTGLVGWHTWGITPRPFLYVDGDRRFWGSLYEPRLGRMIEKGADVSVRGAHGETVLHMAARYGTGESVRLLIAAGLDIEAGTAEGFRPLHDAVRKGNIDAVAALIEAGADVDARNEFGEPPLFMTAIGSYGPATLEGRKAALSALLQAGADPNAQDNYGQTSLYGIAYGLVFPGREYPDRIDAATALLAAGADPLIPSKSGDTALDLARKREFDALIALFEAHIESE
ncbi:MAG: ankyrin repeat domain-containing protein [Maritimibacter sp.]